MFGLCLPECIFIFLFQSVLDSSYYQENVLVDKDFPSEACMEEMSNILGEKCMAETSFA